MKLLRCPTYDRLILFWDGGWLSACHLFEYSNLTVAIDKLHWNAKVQQTRERFTWHRPRNHIASNYDMVYFCLTNLLEYSLQRRKVSVNIVDCGYPHNRTSSL
jgi:hypothetical protein